MWNRNGGWNKLNAKKWVTIVTLICTIIAVDLKTVFKCCYSDGNIGYDIALAIGDKTIADYDTLERYRPIQVAYWLVNPYYEKIYGQVDDIKELLELRNEFLSKEFWEYVLKRLNSVIDQGYDYLRINMEFLSVVKGLFRCNINTDVKQILGKVNAALLKIKDMQQQQD